MSRRRVNVLTISDVVNTKVKMANDTVAMKNIDCESIDCKIDDIIAKYITTYGSMSSDLIKSFVEYYNYRRR